MSDADIIRRLREENDELREEIRQLNERAMEKLGAGSFPLHWAISPTVTSILIDLSSGGAVPGFRLWQNAEARNPTSVGRYRRDRATRDTENPVGIIRVQISKHRRALADLGIEIKNTWGAGYYLPPESLEIVRKALGRGSARSDKQEQEQCPEA